MKKKLKLTACAVSAVLACGAVPVLSAGAECRWRYEGGVEINGMIQLDDKGMLDGLAQMLDGVPQTGGQPYEIYDRHFEGEREVLVETDPPTYEMRHVVRDQLYIVRPRANTLRFVVPVTRVDDDTDSRIQEIIGRYFPGQRFGWRQSEVFSGDDIKVVCSYEIWASAEQAGSAEISNGLMHDLAAENLITAFYTWGQTARYNCLDCMGGMTSYRAKSNKRDGGTFEDWDAVSAWLAEHHPDYELVYTAPDDDIEHPSSGRYTAVPPENTPLAEQFAVAAELYEQFGLTANYDCCAMIHDSWVLGNTMHRTGDLNIDGAVNISDAVLLARLAGNDAGLQLISAGRNNADLNGDDMFTADDLESLLDMLVQK